MEVEVNQVCKTPEPTFFPLHQDTGLLGTEGEAGEAHCILNGKRKVTYLLRGQGKGRSKEHQNIKYHTTKKP